MSMSQEYGEAVNRYVRTQIDALDATAWMHWSATGHKPMLTTFPVGWTCPTCPESFAPKPIEVRE